MDSKEQAIRKASWAVEEALLEDQGCTAYIHPEGVVVSPLIGSMEKRQVFPYAPPRRIPPKGTRVLVWDDDRDIESLGYSFGKTTDAGFLWIYWQKNREGADCAFKNWIELQEVEQ
jgi:hypothetical protein